MKNKIVLFLFLYLFCIIPFQGLTQQKISGIVVDSDSRANVPYASIMAGKTNTISWHDGSFSIEIDKIDSNDSLQVQCLGYENYKIALSDYVLNDIQEIALHQKTFTIAEVNVNARKIKKSKIKKFGIFKRQATGLGNL